MVGIVVIAAIFSYLNPIPANEPLIWKETSDNIRMISEISPMQPGKNLFVIQLEMEKTAPLPKNVELWLTNKAKTQLAPISVPLELVQEAGANTTGIHKYKAEGPYLPFPGTWTAELKITDLDDNEKVFTRKIKLY
jgi:copper transport protein